VPLVTTSDAVLGVTGGIVRQRLLAWGRLPTCLCMVVCGHLIVGGVLGGDTTWLLECDPEEVALFVLPQAVFAAIGQSAWATQVGLATSLGLVMPSLPRHSGAWDVKSAEGNGTNFVVDGAT
jgi:hypothetical protein